MKRIQLLLAMVFAGSMLASAVVAAEGEGTGRQQRQGQGQRGGDPAALFSETDTNEDGKISEKEFTVMHEKRMAQRKERMGDRKRPEGREPPSAEDIFKRLDADEDGFLTKEEMQAARQRRGGGQGGQGEGRGGRQGQGRGGAAE